LSANPDRRPEESAMDMQTDASPASGALHQLRRVRHETVRRRLLTVFAVDPITPRMRRIHFRSPELADFTSLSPDDHVKLFFPGAGGEPAMRDFTPRRFDNAAESLVIDFALHDAGPATDWARRAKPGSQLEIGGPRGSTVVPDDFDWWLLAGDETALPAIGRRVEEMRAGVPVVSIACVDAAEEVQSFRTAADWTGEWLLRDRDGPDDAETARRAIDRLIPATGDGFVWIAGESQFARTLRAHLAERHGHPLPWMKAAGYWKRGEEGRHEPLG
jgi:NADPH-dependent ferric siderophore reductase